MPELSWCFVLKAGNACNDVHGHNYDEGKY